MFALLETLSIKYGRCKGMETHFSLYGPVSVAATIILHVCTSAYEIPSAVKVFIYHSSPASLSLCGWSCLSPTHTEAS